MCQFDSFIAYFSPIWYFYYMKIVFTGGGTLGHIYPALALYDYIKERDKTIDFYWIGTNRENERIVVEKNGIRFFSISSGKLRRYFSFKNLVDVFKVIIGYFQAKRIIKKIKPDLLFSKGGYVSVAVVYAAKRLNIKIVTHESDISLGLATKLNLRVANVIFKGFKLSETEQQDIRFVYSGNPLRSSMIYFKDIDLSFYEKRLVEEADIQYGDCVLKVKRKIDETFKKDKPFILVVGGSLGSLEINELIFKHLDKLVEKYNIYHQMGNQTYKKIEKDCYIGVKQIGEELGYLYKKADLIISRCGANTLNEEIFFRKNILAIPLKNNASRGEQVLNAKYFKKLNMLEVYEKNMNLIDTVKNLLNNNVIEQRNKAFNSFNYIDANETIYLKIKELMK